MCESKKHAEPGRQRSLEKGSEAETDKESRGADTVGVEGGGREAGEGLGVEAQAIVTTRGVTVREMENSESFEAE